ncbi:MAG: GNAT family N-acetyltransferase [Corynebacterium casei]|nr:GNAT family N-acetyltransferase [Corynebacterium casei]
MELARIWPPFGLEITAANGSQEITLRAMRDEDIAMLADATPHAIFGNEIPDHAFGWLFDVDNNPAQFRWSNRAQMTPAHWSLDLVVVHNGAVVGSVDMRANDFPGNKTVETGSWIYHRLQGQGLGTLVRRAIAEISFNHFGAERLTTAWANSNTASAAVSTKLGYQKTSDITVDSLGPDKHTAPGVRAELLRENYQPDTTLTFTVRGVSPELKALLGI